jgi:all-trans-retinol 13,14-reductase
MQDTDGTHWDAIVIGSGIGGMTTAASLSKVGHRVLLLEQYPTLGGLSHSFTIGGFTWDAGIHYLSGVAPGDPARDLLDWLSDTPIEFTSLGAIYDNLHIGDAEPLALSRPLEAQERDLKDRFPEEAKAIEAWTAALGRRGRRGQCGLEGLPALPPLAEQGRRHDGVPDGRHRGRAVSLQRAHLLEGEVQAGLLPAGNGF